VRQRAASCCHAGLNLSPFFVSPAHHANSHADRRSTECLCAQHGVQTIAMLCTSVHATLFPATLPTRARARERNRKCVIRNHNPLLPQEPFPEWNPRRDREEGRSASQGGKGHVSNVGAIKADGSSGLSKGERETDRKRENLLGTTQ